MKLNDILDISAVLLGSTTIYVKIVGNLDDIIATATGLTTLLIALIRLSLWLKGKRNDKEDPPGMP